MATEKRLIDANTLIRRIDDYYQSARFPQPGTNWSRGLELAVELVLTELAVEAVEVVRCRDCKHYVYSPYDNEDMICNNWEYWIFPNDDDFCSCGERKDDA